MIDTLIIEKGGYYAEILVCYSLAIWFWSPMNLLGQDSLNVRKLGSCICSGVGIGVMGVAVSGNYVYVTTWLGLTIFEYLGVIGIEKRDNGKLIVKDVKLFQNHPNPFNPSTTIEFDLPKSSEVTLKVFNVLGEEVTTLVSDRLSAGSFSYEWDASNLASGVYLYRLQAGSYVETRKMILMR